MSRRPSGSKLFTVGLISDTHCNEKEDFSASAYPANAEANPRARHVFACLEREKPAFIMHMGDMINPVPELPTYADAVAQFKEITSSVSCPIHLVPGNHDIGDKPVSWMPAGTINQESISIYEDAFGQHFYAVEYNDIRFVVINAPLINSGLEQEATQREWLEKELTQNAGTRTFVFIHYPIYVSDPDEAGSYDNIEEPGRSWLIRLIKRHKPEALFAAHVHNFWYDVLGETETYVLPSTCFVRQDYSEMYRIDGGAQYGRDDGAKLGFAMLDIYDTGHVVHYQRTYSAKLSPSTDLAVDVQPINRVHSKTSQVCNLAIDMRRSWAEEFDIAPSGAVDEFARKRARNDYPVMALWESGVRTLRVPIQDLIDPRVRRRMQLMAAVGHKFQVYCYGFPEAGTARLLARHADLVDALELVINWEDATAACAEISSLHAQTGLTVCLSRVNRKDASKIGGNQYNHLISHGFSMAELDEIAGFLTKHDTTCAISKIQVTVTRDQCPWEIAVKADKAAEQLGRRLSLYVRSSSAVPAEAFVDEMANTERFLKAAMAALASTSTDVILDTFTDADRGYFVRTGLVDRRYNPRLAAKLLGRLIGSAGNDRWHREPDCAHVAAIKNASGTTMRLMVMEDGTPDITITG